MISQERRFIPGEITLKNLKPDEASKVISAASIDETLEVKCIIRDSLTRRKIASITHVPYLDVKYDMQSGLQALFDAMVQGGGEVLSETIVRRRKIFTPDPSLMREHKR